VTTRIARSGQRAWAFVGGAAELDQIDLSGPHVHPVLIDRPISEVFEIERSGTSNALVVLHGVYASEGTTSAFGWRSFTWPSAMGLTVFDALAPDPMTARRYSSVLLEGLIP
jgi:hypothetical protein